MNLKKNLAAKVAAVMASFAALIATWGLVHQNPPPSAAADAPVAAPTAAPPAPGRARVAVPTPAAATTKRHTRTRVS